MTLRYFVKIVYIDIIVQIRKNNDFSMQICDSLVISGEKANYKLK